MARTIVTIEEIKDRIAKNLSERRLQEGEGDLGTLSIARRRAVTRTFRAHWTGFKAFYPEEVVVLRADLKDGSFWAEGYISALRPSWVLSFRKTPASARGSGGPRPDDKTAHPQNIEESLKMRRDWIESGLVEDEELIRMEDYDDPIEAVDAFFNYTTFYVLKSIDASWDQFGYRLDPSIAWERDEQRIAGVPVDAAIDQGLKRSDILWMTPNTAPDRPIPCWFVYRDGKAYVLSGERQQIIPNAARVRDAHVVTRWKMRDAALVDFDAAVRLITANERQEFEDIAELLLNKRQSVTGTREENLERWLRECVILELTPRV
ncbi:MAG: hypothetical protein ACRDI1_04320 [Actinomycetota bacterium]